MTETCEDDEPHLIIHTETTLATTPDNAVTDTIHHALEGQALLPHTHLVDAGYLDAEMLVSSRSIYQVDLWGPVSLDGSWQAQAATGFDVTHFHIDWAANQVSCPASQTSRWWMSSTDRHGKEASRVKFAPTDGQACPLRLSCTRGQSRTLTLRPNPAEYQALHAARQRQSTLEVREQYARRAGVEGTISQAVRESRLATSSLHGTEESTPPSVHHRNGPEFAQNGGLVGRDPSCSHPHVSVCCAHLFCSEAASHCLGYNNSPTISDRGLKKQGEGATYKHHHQHREGPLMYITVSLKVELEANASLPEMEQQIQAAGRAAMQTALKEALHQREEQEQSCPACGSDQCHSQGTKRRVLLTSFGRVEVPLKRLRCWQCRHRFRPAASCLAEVQGYNVTPALRELAAVVGSSWPDETAAGVLKQLSGVQLSDERLRQLTNEQGSCLARQHQERAQQVLTDAINLSLIRRERASAEPVATPGPPEWLLVGVDGGWVPSREQSGGMEGKIGVVASETQTRWQAWTTPAQPTPVCCHLWVC